MRHSTLTPLFLQDVCLSACVCVRACRYPWRREEGIRFPGAKDGCKPTWVLGTKLSSFEKAVSILDHWAISPAYLISVFTAMLSFYYYIIVTWYLSSFKALPHIFLPPDTPMTQIQRVLSTFMNKRQPRRGPIPDEDHISTRVSIIAVSLHILQCFRANCLTVISHYSVMPLE